MPDDRPVGPDTPWEELPLWLTLEEYAAVMRLKAVRTVQRYIRRGRIRRQFVRGNGTGRRISRDALLPGADGDDEYDPAAAADTLRGNVHPIGR